jgi:hypothetical protein
MRTLAYLSWFALSIFLLLSGLTFILYRGAPITKSGASMAEILPSLLWIAFGFSIFVLGYRCGAKANRIRKGA